LSQFISVDHTVCTGCRECELVCSLSHVGECNPRRSAIQVLRREHDGLATALPLVCQQCGAAPCIGACPENALSRQSDQGTLRIDADRCSGCGECRNACPAGCIFVDIQNDIAISCDLCDGRPQCVTFCHSSCLTLETAESGPSPSIEQLADVRKTLVDGDASIVKGG
jgi:carbon-monoxide dehydrogenase iron sulfur subunit